MAKPVIRDATRCESKASIVIEGLQGSGKSGLALDIAHALTGDWSKVGAVDSENRSLDLFEGLNMSSGIACAPFKKADLTDEHGFIPSMYLELREDFINMGCEAVIFDSISHSWVGSDGILDRVSRLEAENAKVSIRNARRDAIDTLKKQVKEGLPEDVEKDAEADAQKLHDKFVKKIDEIYAAKEKEIMTV